MSSQGLPPVYLPFGPADGSGRMVSVAVERRTKRRYWLNILLFAMTLFTTTTVGARMAHNFDNNLPAFTDDDFSAMARLFDRPSELSRGLPFSLTLMTILMAHEMGHYVACHYYRINATLPFFLPAPTLIGTLGAFIRIRSPIYTRKALFDVGIAGPLAGFVVLLPALAIGMAYSRIIPGIAGRGDLVFGAPVLQRLMETALFPGISASDISLHPIARAAWVGMLATALNLLPIGQLDGGHILYSFAGRYHKSLSLMFVVALVPIGLFYSYSWLVWAAVLFILGMRHPSIQDPAELGSGRGKLGVLALLIFVLSFTLAPVRISNGF